MRLKVLLGPLVAAAYAFAAAAKQQCGAFTDLADTKPTCNVTSTPVKFQPLVFDTSKVIWTGENAVPVGNNPIGKRVFRKNITSACGKCAVCADMIVVSDDNHEVFVNGNQIGSGVFWVSDVAFSALQPLSNLFTIVGNNLGGAAGIMATIRIHYSDGSQDTFITDETWRTFQGTPPAGSTMPSFDDSKWTFATLQAMYGAGWSKPTLPPILPLDASKWIWTSDVKGSVAPAGTRAFRKTLNDCTKRAVCATAVISAQNKYTFYANGQIVGKGESITSADAWTIPNLRSTYNTFAVSATNTNDRAGLIATILVTYSDGTNATIVTDSSWKASKSVSDGFEGPTFDDDTWEDATIAGQYGIAPYPRLAIPLA